MKRIHAFHKHRLAPYFTAGLFGALIIIAIFDLWYRSRIDEQQLIARDLHHLASIFEKIDKTADILGFDEQRNAINFLTIKKDGFVGSKVGPMNVAYPDKWEGPYVQDNPSIRGHLYQVIYTKQGYFITPGNGVKLPNDKIIGKDLILNEQADMQKLLLDEQGLHYQDTALAVPISIKGSSNSIGIIPEDLAQAQQVWVEQYPA